MSRHAAVAVWLALLLGAAGAGENGPAAKVDLAKLPVNQWAELPGAIGRRGSPQLVYNPELKRFMLLGGDVGWREYPKPHPYDVLALEASFGRWENWLPEGKNWGPKFGDCKAPGWKNERWLLTDREGNTRPSLVRYTGAKWYHLSCYDPDGRRFYFYVHGSTFSYDPAARKWTDHKPATHPTKALGGLLLWGSTCFDAVNKKVFLFGGGNITSERGDLGTWTYDPAGNAWEQLKFESDAIGAPGGRAADLAGEAKRLAELLRARYYRAELTEHRKVKLGGAAGKLADAVAKLERDLAAARAKADAHEKKQIDWALGDLARSRSALGKVKGAASGSFAAGTLADADVARRALDAARDALALQPPPRALSRLAYDASAEKIVLFGGDRLDMLYADTWVFDCRTKRWKEQRPATGPAPRGGHALVYLPKSRRVLLFGGYTYTSTRDYCGAQWKNHPFQMWVYGAAKNEWKLLPHSGKKMPSATAVAASDDDTVLAVQSVRYRPAITWACRVDASAASAPTAGVAPGTITRRTGPYTPELYDSAPKPDAAAAEARLKALPANKWTEIVPPQKPWLDRCWGTITYSPDHDVIMHWSGGHSSHCGTEVVRYHPGIDRWSLATDSEQPWGFVYSNDGTPGQHSFAGRPWMTGHTYSSYGYDPVLRRMVKAGKRDYTYFFDPATGEWDGHEKGNPFIGSYYTANVITTPKGAACWAAQIRDRVKSGLWLMDAKTRTWKALPLKGELPRISPDRHGACYEAKRDRILFFSSFAKGDVTAYDFKTGEAKALGPAGKEKATVSSREAIYLENCDMVLIGAHVTGPDGKMLMPVYDCAKNRWLGVDLGGANPVGRRGKKTAFNNSVGLAYDPKRKLIWSLGQRSQIAVLRFDPKTADLRELE
ncbi:MAG: Kelch repeat-containing protein [Planctomycetota bacterium]|jgi:hypothetical protein